MTVTPTPTLIIEASWEVCNKVGGTHTVLSGRAAEMMQRHDGQVLFVGPLQSEEALSNSFEACEIPFLKEWLEQTVLPFQFKLGRWRTSANPPVLLVDYSVPQEELHHFYYQLWKQYGIPSDKGFGDYPEALSFSLRVAEVIASLYTYYHKRRPMVAIFDEWTVGGALLRLKHLAPTLPTIFITHATTLGRSIASNGKELYRYLEQYDNDIMARELNVEAKHYVERAAALTATQFATVSDTTAQECQQFIGRKPVVLPNGFPLFSDSDYLRLEREHHSIRQEILKVVATLYGVDLPKDSLLALTSGRYEYRNKGFDVVIDMLYNLSVKKCAKPLVMIFAIPAWVAMPRGDLRAMLQDVQNDIGESMQCPFLTHWLHHADSDTLTQALIRFYKVNGQKAPIYPVFIPCYLDGNDGIFNIPYYDFVSACDLTLFPSYYEPWGYTPHESIALGVPTVSSTLSGFGLAMADLLGRPNGDVTRGIAVVERNDENYIEAVEFVADIVQYFQMLPTRSQKQQMALQVKKLASQADWIHFYNYYQQLIDDILTRHGEVSN